ncbi:MAG: nuclear transport factor 2 family protein, partial [Geodermatophilaceae bacterium]|nr:nuclear transport factor 2 family protein [Geodermatophilaceae bacterium]
MDATRQLIERFFEALDRRDWVGFAAVLHPEVVYEIPQSRERIRGRDRYVRFNREYPG